MKQHLLSIPRNGALHISNRNAERKWVSSIEFRGWLQMTWNIFVLPLCFALEWVLEDEQEGRRRWFIGTNSDLETASRFEQLVCLPFDSRASPLSSSLSPRSIAIVQPTLRAAYLIIPQNATTQLLTGLTLHLLSSLLKSPTYDVRRYSYPVDLTEILPCLVLQDLSD